MLKRLDIFSNSPHTRSQASSGVETPEIEEHFLQTMKVRTINLQIPSRKHKTPSPKSMSSPKINLAKAYEAYMSFPKRKNSVKAVNSEIAIAMQEKSDLEIRVSKLKLELQKLNIERRRLKESDKIIVQLQSTLDDLIKENTKIKAQKCIRSSKNIDECIQEFREKLQNFFSVN